MRTPLRYLLPAIGVFAVNSPAIAAVCEARSPAHTTALLELYTSEGCSSCPPADRWLKALPDNKELDARRLVSLAFHVDYWNYLGWKDPFSQAAFSERQTSVVRRANASTVYTPATFLGGAEYSWRRRNVTAAVEEITRKPARADIQLRLDQRASKLSIDANARLKTAERAALYVAVTENNLRTQVRAGENGGRLLEHSAVVRLLLEPTTANSERTVNLRHTVTLDPKWKVPDLSVVAFVQKLADADVLQAVSAPLCP
jgi:hypothetical protein